MNSRFISRRDTVTFPILRLKPREDRRIAAGHLWVFSNEVDTRATPLTAFAPGDTCRIESDRGRFLAYGYVHPGTLICARVLSRDANDPPGRDWLLRRLRRALDLRERVYELPFYRWVYGETDGLPGLVLERYGDVVVGQVGTAGMESMKGDVADAVRDVANPAAMLWKNDSAVRDLEGLPGYVEAAFGDVPATVTLTEHGVRYVVPLYEGQKTGWFYDQSANRHALRKYVGGKTVLDVFSYLGAWGLGAADAGARAVTCVDSSATALAYLRSSAEANALSVHVERGDAFDVMQRLANTGVKFDVVVIDPPAFIKRRKEIRKGEAAYRRLNHLAMQLLERDGILVSCSCSYHMSADALLGAIQHAARRLGRMAQVVEAGGQAPDHPVHPGIGETRYLKSFICRVVAD